MRWLVREPGVAGLHTVPEDNTSEDNTLESSFTPRHKPVLQRYKDSKAVVNLRPIIESPIRDKPQSTRDASSEPSGRRDSVYTDIDDGSFIEFCHGKEKGDDPSSKIPLLYYTSTSNNDTQYSTSTKTNHALVGFRKCMDKLRTKRDVWEETEAEEVTMHDKVKTNTPHDETIITCSADMRKHRRKGPPPPAINSTVIDKSPQDNRVHLPYAFSEISTLTTQPEIPGATNKQRQINPSQQDPAKHQIIDLLESSGEGESHNNEVLRVPRRDNVRPSPVSVNTGLCKASHPPPPSPQVCGGGASGECPSIISEDVSVVSTSQESRFHIPHKTNTDVVQKNTRIDASSRREGKIPVIYKKKEIEETHAAGVGCVTQAPGSAFVKQSTDTKVTENQRNPVHKWVMSSPFKESSFDSSFLQGKQDTFISESPSQPKLDNKYESCEFHAINPNKNRLNQNPDTYKQGIKSPSLSKKYDTPIGKVIASSDGEESECDFIVKRTTKQQRALVLSTSEESEDDRRNGMYVTQRRKKKHTKVIEESPEKDYFEESFCLRLSRSQNDTNTQKTVHTIGKSAASPQTRVDNFTKTNNQVPEKLKKINESPLVANEDLQNNTEKLKKINESPLIANEDLKNNTEKLKKINESSLVAMKNLQNNTPSFNILAPVTKMHLSPSQEPLPTPSPSPKTGSSKYVCDSDGPLDLSLIRRELDSIYSTEWRKKEDAIFKTDPKEYTKQEDRITRPRKPSKESGRRRSKSCPRLDLESEEENSFFCKVSETSGDGEDDTNNSEEEEERHERNENNKSDSTNSQDEKTTKMTPQHPDSPEEDSFEEYLKRARTLTQQKKQQQEVKYYDDEDKYESSFINDDTSDEESYSLPLVTQKPWNRSSVYPRTNKHKNRVPKIQDKDTDEERHESSMDNGSESSKGTPSPPEEDSFEEYLKRVRVLTQQKKKQQKVKAFNDHEDRYGSNLMTDDESDDGSYSLPSVSQKPLKTPSENLASPKYKISVLKKQGKGSTGTNQGPRTTTTWRDSPTITITSDSDSDEFYSVTQTKKKVVQRKSYFTPRTKERGKVLPKTEGHCRQFTKRYETGQLSPRLPFLASLSSNVNMIQCHPDALPYVKNFKKNKEELVDKLYKYYNKHVFDGKLPPSMNIKWNQRLTKTAGYCYYQMGRSSENRRGSRIELSTKASK